MPISRSTGGIFQLDPSLYGLPALGQQIDRFTQLRERKEEREEERAERDEEQEFQRNVQQFQNLLALGDREGAARFHNLVFGTQAEARLSGEEAIDRMFTEGLTTMSEGGQPGQFVTDMINQRVFGSLDPEADRKILANDAARSGLLVEYQRGLNEGLSDEQALTRAQARGAEIANRAAEREAQQRQALDNAIATDPTIPGNTYLEAVAFGNLTDQQLAQALTREQTTLTGAQTLETRARTRNLFTQREKLRAEIQALAVTSPEAATALQTSRADIEGIGSLVAGRVPADQVVQYVMQGESAAIPEASRALLDEAAETYRTQIRTSLEQAIREADPANASDLLILKNPEEFGPELLSVAMTRFVNRNFGQGIATLEDGGWFGPNLEMSIAAEELLNIANQTEGLVGEGGSVEDIEAQIQEDRALMITELGSEEAALGRLQSLLPEMDSDEERAYVQALIDTFEPQETIDEGTHDTTPGPSGNSLVDRVIQPQIQRKEQEIARLEEALENPEARVQPRSGATIRSREEQVSLLQRLITQRRAELERLLERKARLLSGG